MSLLEILDSVNNFNGGHRSHSTDKILGGSLLGDILAGGLIKFGAVGSIGVFSFIFFFDFLPIILCI